MNLTLKINFLVLDDLLMAHFRARMSTQAELQTVARVFCLSLCKNRTGKGCSTRKNINISPRLRGQVCMERG